MLIDLLESSKAIGLCPMGKYVIGHTVGEKANLRSVPDKPRETRSSGLETSYGSNHSAWLHAFT